MGEKTRAERKASDGEPAVGIMVAEERRCVGLAEVAKRVGCHKLHLSAVLHGRRKASDKLRRELLALGIAETTDGRRL